MTDRTPTDIIAEVVVFTDGYESMTIGDCHAAEAVVAALDAAGFDIVARTDPAVCPTCGSDDPSDRYAGEDGSRCNHPFHTPGADQ